MLAALTAFHRMNKHLIRLLDLLEMMSTMAGLSTWFLAALFPQTLGDTDKAIGGGRQTTIVTIFGHLPFECFDALPASK